MIWSKPSGLKCEQLALLLPVHEVLHGLEERHVDGELASSAICFSICSFSTLLKPPVTVTSMPGNCCMNSLARFSCGARRPAGVEHHLLLGLGLLVELGRAFRRAAVERQQRSKRERRPARPAGNRLMVMIVSSLSVLRNDRRRRTRRAGGGVQRAPRQQRRSDDRQRRHQHGHQQRHRQRRVGDPPAACRRIARPRRRAPSACSR